MEDKNYKERYEQAFETAKDMLDHTAEDYRCVNFNKDDLRNLLSLMFPQLQLSRDEQIRRALIKYYKCDSEKENLDALDGFSYDEIADYLERQKPMERSKEYADCISLIIKYFDGKSESEDTNFADKKVFKRWARVLDEDSKINSVVMDGKPVPTKEQSVDTSAGVPWTEIDENRYNFLMDMILESDNNFATKNGLKNWLEEKLIKTLKYDKGR